MNTVKFVKHYNFDKEDRLEFLFVNFDYIDGADIIAKLLCKTYEMKVIKSIDGIYFNIINVGDKDIEYEIVWHEDVGNYIYAMTQDENTNKILETRILNIVKQINKLLDK